MVCDKVVSKFRVFSVSIGVQANVDMLGPSTFFAAARWQSHSATLVGIPLN